MSRLGAHARVDDLDNIANSHKPVNARPRHIVSTKGCITGTASQLNPVAVTRCQLIWSLIFTGTSVALSICNTGRQAHEEKQLAGLNKDRTHADFPPDDASVDPDNYKKNSSR